MAKKKGKRIRAIIISRVVFVKEGDLLGGERGHRVVLWGWLFWDLGGGKSQSDYNGKPRENLFEM